MIKKIIIAVSAVFVLVAFIDTTIINWADSNLTKNIEVVTGINIKVDGSKFIPKDINGEEVDVLLYNNTTYVPIRAISNIYKSDIDWDEETMTVLLNTKNNIDTKKDPEYSQVLDNQSNQSNLMLEHTGLKWPPELEKDLRDIDFYGFNLDIKNPQLITDMDSLFVLTNKANYFPDDFTPKNLVNPNTKYAGGGDRNKLRDVAANALDLLVQDASKIGYDIQHISAYRSIAYQRGLFDRYVKKDGIEKANQYSSKPGYSEHHTGLSVDVSSPSMNFGLGQEYGVKKEGIWLSENAHKYGFVIRYQKGKEDLTGYTYEPWHLRYFGVPMATYLKESNLCYEEFIGLQVGKTPDQIRIK